MGCGFSYEQMNKNKEENEQGRYYLGNGLWTHPETGGDFFFEDESKNK